MKNRTLRIITGICLMLLISCEKVPQTRFGFDAQFYNNDQGLCIMAVGHAADEITLNGTIEMYDGELEVELIDPDGCAMYAKIFQITGVQHINETFTATPGYWKLKYKSRQGAGSIDLHLNKF